MEKWEAEKWKELAAAAAADEHEADKGKQLAATDEHEAAKGKQVVDASGDGTSGWDHRVGRDGRVEPNPKYETEAQIRRKKKKNFKNKQRQERKSRGEKIWSPADVATFDESDSDDDDEESDGVGDDEVDMHRKSRVVLKKLKNGDIPYLLGPGEYKCPWCFRKEMPNDYLGMLQHATYYRSQKHAAHLRVKHAAYSVFLLKHLPKARIVQLVFPHA